MPAPQWRVNRAVNDVVERHARREAFVRYVQPEMAVLYRVALSMTRQPGDAEDLVQETLLRALRSLRDFDGAHPRAWLLTILRNTERNGHRRARPELLDHPDELADLVTAPSAEGPEALLLDAVFDSAVERACRTLPAAHRQVVALVDIDGHSYAEAAAVLGSRWVRS